MKKKFLIFSVSLYLVFSIFSQSSNDTQVIKSDSWLYDDLYALSSEVRQANFYDVEPMTIGEIKFYLKNINYELLSPSGQKTYEKVYSFLYKNDDFFPESPARIFLNAKLNPEFYYKSNDDIPWSFDYYVNDFALTIPLILGFSNYITIEPDFLFAKNQIAAKSNDNWTNIPFTGSQVEFLMPKFAYGSTGMTFNDWGFSFHVGKEGLQLGKTSLGSIVYSRTFESDFYSQLSFYTHRLKYSLDVTQVDNSTYLYLHQINLRPFKNFRVSMVEGSLLNSDFELRYLNPFMIMHSFGSWYDYYGETEKKYYGESNFCAYMAFTFDWMPLPRLRIYGAYSQNEILDLGGSRTDSALSVPDSIGGQLGVEYNFLLPNAAYLKTNLEAVYTSPYLYVKHSPDWSLYKERDDMQANESVYSWLGSPFGPDSFAIQLSAKYQPASKWSCSLGYLFKIHGENTAENLFSQKYTTEEGESIYSYYPSVQYTISQTDEERLAAKEKGRYMWMTGTPEFTNQIKLKASYFFMQNLTLNGQFVYTFILNNNNILNQNDQGCEVSLGLEYKIF